MTIIAEAGVNHNGSMDLARRLIDAAAAAGADIVKFQSFRADALAAPDQPKAAYQRETTDPGESQHAMLAALELSDDDHRGLAQHCAGAGIEFLSTPFDLDSLRSLVDDFGVRRVKIGSGDMTNAPLLHAAARSGRPVILSTGMADLEEVREALGVLAHGLLDAGAPTRAACREAGRSAAGRAALAERVTVLHCTTDYPAAPSDINLRAMDHMAGAFGLPVGFSDHSEGVAIPIAAAARGAVMIEKHLTLDRTMHGPDHRASLEPDAFAAMVDGIREAEAALGDGIKRPRPAERANIPIARKCVVAARDLDAGAVLADADLAVLRAGEGLSPFAYWDLLGAKLRRPLAKFDCFDDDSH